MNMIRCINELILFTMLGLILIIRFDPHLIILSLLLSCTFKYLVGIGCSLFGEFLFQGRFKFSNYIKAIKGLYKGHN